DVAGSSAESKGEAASNSVSPDRAALATLRVDHRRRTRARLEPSRRPPAIPWTEEVLGGSLGSRSMPVVARRARRAWILRRERPLVCSIHDPSLPTAHPTTATARGTGARKSHRVASKLSTRTIDYDLRGACVGLTTRLP